MFLVNFIIVLSYLIGGCFYIAYIISDGTVRIKTVGDLILAVLFLPFYLICVGITIIVVLIEIITESDLWNKDLFNK